MRVLIVDAIRVRRDGLASLLGGNDWIDFMCTTANLEESIACVKGFHPEIVLLDASIPESTRTIRAIADEDPGAKVIAFGVETEQAVIACAEAGVVGYLLRDGSLEELVAVIQSVAHGEMQCSPQMGATLLKRVGTLANERRRPEQNELTRREREILWLVDEGLSNKEIAHRLFIQVGTVKNHVHNLLGKLKVHRRGQASASVK